MYFIDVQGTLISDSDKSPINGACKLIESLNLNQIPYVVITNNTKVKSDEFLGSLRAKGLAIKDGAYLDPFCVLNESISPCNVALFGAMEFIDTMQNLGYTQDKNSPKAILIASWDKFSFDDFATINELALKGIKIIAMHETSIYKKNGRLYPGVGAIAAMVSYATGASFDSIGKPSLGFYTAALKLLKAQNSKAEFKNITIISDDATGDLYGAKELNMKTSLVLSGKISKDNISNLNHDKIDNIYDDVSQILEIMR
ncbi:HAD-IIA family hydrolase [Campylobacter porcelli]|uniref:HAD-IIA family hydrolase n=1 Tax=Campylobacter porcelli TaxID=1660073 RepID=UPI000A32D2E9|nr:HAD-IIA family hydrolase [Campylobacter sp. P0078]